MSFSHYASQTLKKNPEAWGYLLLFYIENSWLNDFRFKKIAKQEMPVTKKKNINPEI